MVDRVAHDTARQVRVMSFANIDALHIGQAHRNREIVGDAVGGAERRAADAVDAVRVDVLAGGRDQVAVAEPAELEIFGEERDSTMPGFQRRSRDGDDWSRTAGVRGAARMMR